MYVKVIAKAYYSIVRCVQTKKINLKLFLRRNMKKEYNVETHVALFVVPSPAGSGTRNKQTN